MSFNIEIPQGILIEQLKKFLKLQNRNEESKNRIANTEGLCFGLPVVLAAKYALGKKYLMQHLEDLKTIRDWDGKGVIIA